MTIVELFQPGLYGTKLEIMRLAYELRLVFNVL
jgi:hypothetical protein